MREAVFAAGAGRIGDYERCSWYTEGTGTFLALEGADPRSARSGRGARAEYRLETVFPRSAQADVSPRCARRTRTRSPPSTSTRSL